MKVRFWTVQKLAVVTAIIQHGTYQPVFEYSDYAESIPGLQDLYGFILDSYNYANGTEHPGLIYTFLEQKEDQSIYDFEDYASFKKFICEHSFAIKSLWNNLASKDTVIMCLEREVEGMNILPIDINDFQYMMPPVMNVPPYSEDYYNFLLRNIANGIPVKSIFPSGVLQAHLPNIRAEDVYGIYPMFEL